MTNIRTFLRIVALGLCIAAGTTQMTKAQTWDCGANGNNLTATLKDSTLTVTGIGAMANYHGEGGEAPWWADKYSIANIVIEDGVTTIGNIAFAACEKATSAIIGNGVTTIGTNAFQSCGSLTSIIIPNSVVTMGDGAFGLCRKLSSATIGSGVTTIGNQAFMGTGLTSITIPDNVISMGYSTFQNCISLISATISNNITSIGRSTFSSCSKLTSIIIPDSVTVIGREAFGGCSSLTSIIISDNVDSIGYSAFGGCSKLTSIVISNSVTSIGDYAFNVCSGLTSLTIGNGVTSIGNGAFQSCSKLALVTVQWAEPLSISSGVFSGVTLSKVKLCVPEGTKEKYASADVWEKFNPIEECDGVGIAETHRNASVRVYPNPTTGQLTISLPNPSEGGAYTAENVEIYDVVGQNVGAYPCGRPEMTIDISHLASGMYFLKVGNKTARFMKE